MPPYKRMRAGFGRMVARRRWNAGLSGKRAARVLRSIGAPAMTHTFARPGQRLRLTNDGNNYYINGTAMGALAPGVIPTSTAFGLALGSVQNSFIRGAKDFGLSQVFQFSYLNAVSDLANLYDNYRIKAVKLKFDLSYNSTPGEQTSGTGGALPFAANSLPMVHYAVDPDDNTPPQSVADVLQYSKSKSMRFGDKSFSITLTPRAQGAVSLAGGSATTLAVGSMLPAKTWLDSNGAQTVPHFGLKMFIENMPEGTSTSPGTGTGQWNWLLTISPVYILECKNVH